MDPREAGLFLCLTPEARWSLAQDNRLLSLAIHLEPESETHLDPQKMVFPSPSLHLRTWVQRYQMYQMGNQKETL